MVLVLRSLLLILQRYEFSSKSQHTLSDEDNSSGCCWYYKGTNFQANHNACAYWHPLIKLLLILQRYEFSSKSQPINTFSKLFPVVADTTKVRIFKQITTYKIRDIATIRLLLILQRYEFSSKSQRYVPRYSGLKCCCWYYKGTNFQANHNESVAIISTLPVVADTTKVRIFKQITTGGVGGAKPPQVVADTTKVRIFKQITTNGYFETIYRELLLILQRYEFSSKSQLRQATSGHSNVVADTTKVRIFKQITTVTNISVI